MHRGVRGEAARRLPNVEVASGGITRVALDRGALVVNVSQRGGAKDSWVMA
jgi:uncharacterized circularly permuted ATP-grasp superfamily protein